MSDSVISVEGLGKRYRIGAQREQYSALRDVVAIGTKALGRRLLGRRPARAAYEEFWALKDISFDVKRGECVGIIGRNGAGKSTLLKLLSRITEPTTGRFRVKGRVASLLEVGTGFHPELTGRENVSLNGAILGMGRREIARKFDEIVAFAEVEKFLDTPVKHYSSGMYMRLAFAVAAHLEPEILIVDEVLAVGDADFQKKCLGKMGEVARGGRTVLFVSHNMGAIQTLCSRAAALAQGRMIDIGPTTRVVTDFLGSSDRDSLFRRTADSDRPVSILTARFDNVALARDLVLKTEVTIRSSCESFVSIDLRISDNHSLPVGFAAVGSFNKGQEVHLTPGTTVVASTHDVRLLANGTYRVSIDVADPTIGYHDRLEHCLSFEIDTQASEGCYRRLQQSWGLGFIELPYVRHTASTVS